LIRVLQIFTALWRFAVVPAITRRREPPGPVRLRLALEYLGGTWIKLGQALALRFDLLPTEYCLELFRLLNEVKPFPYEDVRRTIEAELGAPPETLFRSFEPESFAAASIGQVHRAVLKSGEQAAVKVQRPGVRTLIRRDIRLMYLGAGILDRARVFGETKTVEVVNEFARWTANELDYRVEGRQAYTLRENAAGDPIEHDAKVYFDLTSERVLTMELIEGVPVIDIFRAIRENDAAYLRRLERAGHDLERIALHVAWNSLNQIYRQGYFHADLHPANLFVLEDDRIGYVDFGIVGSVTADIRESLVHYAWNLFQGNVDRAAEEFMRWVTPSERTDVVAARQELMRLLEEYLFSLRQGAEGAAGERRIAVSRDGAPADRPAASTFEVDVMRMIRGYGMSIAPSVVTYFKAVVTANAVMFELSPTFDLERVENDFFGTMILDDARRLTDARNLSSVVFDYSYRLTLASVEGVRADEATFTAYVDRIRRRITVMALLAVPIAAALLLPPVRSQIRGNPWLYWGIVALLVALIAGILQQGRRLRPRIERLPSLGRAFEERRPVDGRRDRADAR
jgi:predicted unusual protein kinase regulating ubiquinone biosynthesis (AarF/ABC1/UbiB family)